MENDATRFVLVHDLRFTCLRTTQYFCFLIYRFNILGVTVLLICTIKFPIISPNYFGIIRNNSLISLSHFHRKLAIVINIRELQISELHPLISRNSPAQPRLIGMLNQLHLIPLFFVNLIENIVLDFLVSDHLVVIVAALAIPGVCRLSPPVYLFSFFVISYKFLKELRFWLSELSIFAAIVRQIHLKTISFAPIPFHYFAQLLVLQLA